MSGQLTPVYPAETVYRVGRNPDPWAWPDWSQASPDSTFGNRCDDPLGSFRVLYASSQELGALVETLARFRPDLEVVAGLQEIEGDDDPWPAGAVPRRWLRDRALGVGTLNGAYADIGDARSTTASTRSTRRRSACARPVPSRRRCRAASTSPAASVASGSVASATALGWAISL